MFMFKVSEVNDISSAKKFQVDSMEGSPDSSVLYSYTKS